jgi:hypothetical protein
MERCGSERDISVDTQASIVNFDHPQPLAHASARSAGYLAHPPIYASQLVHGSDATTRLLQEQPTRRDDNTTETLR